MFSLQDKIAYVTGAGSGIGRATAKRLAEAGAHVYVLDVDDRGGEETARAIGGAFLHTDVADAASVAGVMGTIADRSGRIDIAVNNAGIALALEGIQDVTPEHFDAHLAVNARGVLNGIRFAADHMSDGGAIINTSSILGLLATPGYTSYVASKFAVVGITKVAAVELGPRGIRVNCVSPTTVNTPMLDTFPSAKQEATAYARASALQRIIEPEHVAALIHFLAADDCPVISGQAIAIDAGITAGVSSYAWNEALETA